MKNWKKTADKPVQAVFFLLLVFLPASGLAGGPIRALPPALYPPSQKATPMDIGVDECVQGIRRSSAGNEGGYASAGSAEAYGGATGLPVGLHRAVDDLLEGYLESGVPGLMVSVSTPDWEATWTKGTADLETRRPAAPTDTFRIASISKTFTAVVVLQLVDEGKLSLDDPLSRYGEGGFGVPNAGNISLRQLLNHTSGIFDWSDTARALADLCACTPAESSLLSYTPREMVEYAVSTDPYFPPGEDFRYCDTNYILLGLIIEEATGFSLQSEIAERLIGPLGLDDTVYPTDSSMPGTPMHAYWTPYDPDDPDENICSNWSEYTEPIDGALYNPSREFGCGAMISTLADMLTWSRALGTGVYRDRSGREERLISEAAQREQFTWGPYPMSEIVAFYGLGVMDYRGGLGHGGDLHVGYSSGITYLPAAGASVVAFLNSEAANGAELASEVAGIILPERRVLAGGDYNGDGTDDVAVYRPVITGGSIGGLWAARGLGRKYFGMPWDVPVSGDYDGDGTDDPAVFRPFWFLPEGGFYSLGLWAVRGVTRTYYGRLGDLPVPADYDGDGTSDPAVFRGGEGLWAVSGITRVYYGNQFDEPVPGDYNGDGTDEIAVFRPSTGLWAVRGGERGVFGRLGDVPVPGDHDGDRRIDRTVFHPAIGLWRAALSSGGERSVFFGEQGDLPVPADYNGDSVDNVGIFRGSSGLWAIRNLTRTYFGTSGDIPVAR